MLLRRFAAGDAAANDELFSLLYDELRRLAGRMLEDQARATLQPTELVHEAWLRLLPAQGRALTIDDRRHFRRLCTKAMRHLLVDRARRRVADKRGGGQRAVTLDEGLLQARDEDDEAAQALAVHEGLERLQAVDPELAAIVELRFFGGLSMEQVAEALDVSRRTAQRGWRLARAWWLTEYGEGES